MKKIIKHGVQNEKPVRKFRCSRCYCKFKTDEYEYGGTMNGTMAIVVCPECGKTMYIEI